MDGGDFNQTDHQATRALAQRIVVAIPVLNEAGVIEACIRSLMEGDDALREVHCVVADGGSADGTQDIVTRLAGEFPNLELVANPGRLQSAGVNAVADAAPEGRDILIRCDAHSIYPDGFVLDVARSLEAMGSDSLVVPMDAVGEGCFQRANAWIVDTPLGSGGSAHRGGRASGYVDHGHHAGFRLDRFRQIGGYDASFSHNEDAEYDTRLRQADGQVYLDADIRIQYMPRAGVKALARQYFGYGKGRARTVLKHREKPRLRQMIPVLNILLLAGSLVIAPFHWIGLVWPCLYLSLLVATSAWLAASKTSLCGLYGGVALGAMHLAWGAGFLRQAAASLTGKRH